MAHPRLLYVLAVLALIWKVTALMTFPNTSKQFFHLSHQHWHHFLATGSGVVFALSDTDQLDNSTVAELALLLVDHMTPDRPTGPEV